MKKRLLLCMLLVLLLTTTALASEDRWSTRIDALCDLPDIIVTVPPTAEVFINPYKLPLDIEAGESTAQIVSTPASIENQSKVPLSVTATVTGALKEGSNMRLTSYGTQTPDMLLTSKSAFVYFEMQAAEDGGQVEWDGEYDAEKHQLVRIGTSKTKKNIAIIAQADQPKHFGAFRLTGDCVQSPRQGWSEEDGINVTIAFTFTPLPVWTEVP